ncbi:MAG: PepSY-like domain-containing protein [Muribaculaceae bacterium]|nr:PepSY-like domain-containing protein [Muribaculaceae bacterium]
MKKTFMFIILGIMAVLTWSCSDDDDKDVPVSYEMLPAQAKEFIATYYPGDRTIKIEREGDHSGSSYEVVLASGHEIEFDAAGLWIDVDAPNQQAVPSAIVPEPIRTYVSTNFPAYLINEITRYANGYEIELTNGLELHFDKNGVFTGKLDY